jgi:hypothetical protein
MTDFSLLLEAPDREWATHVESLIRRALAARGSLSLGVLGEGLPDVPAASGCFVTGLALCDGTHDEILAIIVSALVDFEVEARSLDAGLTQIVVRPVQS